MSFCYHCNTELSGPNISIEHIISKSIGGVLSSKNILCSRCNNIFGHTIDSELFSDLSPLLSLLQIPVNGKIPDIKNLKNAEGETYHLEEGRKPKNIRPVIEVDKEKGTIHLETRDEKEALHILKKKIINFDPEMMKGKFKKGEYYLDSPLNIQLTFGSEPFFKAVLKMAINGYLYFGKEKKAFLVDQAHIQDAIKILQNNESTQNIVKHLYSGTVLPGEFEVSHTLHYRGCSTNRLLYTYVELLNVGSYVVKLNTEYIGPDFEYTYCYDLIEKKELDKKIKLSSHDVVNYNLTFEDEIKFIQKRLNRVSRISDARQVDIALREIVVKSFTEFIQKHPEGINEQTMDEFFEDMSLRLAHFINHKSRIKALDQYKSMLKGQLQELFRGNNI